MLDKSARVCYNKYRKRKKEGNKTMTMYKVIVKLTDNRQSVIKVTGDRVLAFYLRKEYAKTYKTVFVKEVQY